MTPAEFKAAREKLGLTPVEMAVALGYSPRGAAQRISEIENGAARPDRSKLILLRLYLSGVTPPPDMPA